MDCMVHTTFEFIASLFDVRPGPRQPDSQAETAAGKQGGRAWLDEPQLTCLELDEHSYPPI